ncbi:MAG: hypothetical protein ABEK16_00705 [Candidatus Nanohalobium sp.]
MKRKGQFMVISAVIAGIIVVTLSTSVSRIQNQEFHPTDLPEHINQLRDEAARISDGGITPKEQRNFRKMTGYIESYSTTIEFRSGCVKVTLESSDRRVELPCMN